MSLLSKYADIIRSVAPCEIVADTSLGGKLTLGIEGDLQVDYAPFDYLNLLAKVALVGITPGRQQARNALLEANHQLNAGADLETVARAAKHFGSFSGPMRNNLVLCLDAIGVHEWLGIESTSGLWDKYSDLVHFTSGVMFPTYVRKNGKLENWNGRPLTANSELLSRITREFLAVEAKELASNDCVFVALGPKAAEAIQSAGIDDGMVIKIPHPSPASAERTAYFAGIKPREKLSKQTNPEKFDAMRAEAIEKIARLKSLSAAPTA